MVVPLRIVTASRPPLVTISKNGDGAPTYGGLLFDLLPKLLEEAGLQDTPYNVYTLPGGVSGGTRLKNGSWTGIMGELTRNKADMALFPLTLTSTRNDFISSTVPFMDNGYGLLVKLESMDTGYSFLLPFQISTWLLILAALVAVILFVSFMDKWTRHARYRAIERYYGLEKSKMKQSAENVMEHASESIYMLIGAGGAPSSRTWSVKLLFIAWAIFSIIMLSAYTANLTANLTVSRLGSAIKSLSDLKASGRPFGVPMDSSIAKYFKDSSDALATSLSANMIEYRNQDAAVADVRSGKLAAYAADYPTIKAFTEEPPCDLGLASDSFGPGQLVIGLKPNSTIEERLNVGLLKLLEDGTMADLTRKWFVEMSTCASQESTDTSSTAGLGIDNVYAVFVLLAVGIGIAMLWATAEVLYYRYGHTQYHTHKGESKLRGLLTSIKAIFTRSPGDRSAATAGPPGLKLERCDTVAMQHDLESTLSEGEDEMGLDHWQKRVRDAKREAAAAAKRAKDLEEAAAVRAKSFRNGAAAKEDDQNGP